MEDAAVKLLMTPIVQFGFAGMCLGLLGILIWLMNHIIRMSRGSQEQLVSVINRNNAVIEHNTSAIKELTIRMMDQSEKVDLLKDEILRRSCTYKGDCS